jgi:hypothetical protein
MATPRPPLFALPNAPEGITSFFPTPLEIRLCLSHIHRERMIGLARSFMAACTNPNAQVEIDLGFPSSAVDSAFLFT